MATDSRTTNRNYKKPSPDNLVSEDFARLIDSFDAIDLDIASLLSSVSRKAASTHQHQFADVPGLQAALDGKQSTTWRPALGELANVNVNGAATGQFLRLVGSIWQPATISVSWNNISDRPSSFPVAWADVSGKPTSFSSAWADVSGKPVSFPSAWADVTGKPSTFTPSTHGHAQSDISGLASALAGKADSSHIQPISTVTGLQAALDSKQPIGNYQPAGAYVTGVSQLISGGIYFIRFTFSNGSTIDVPTGAASGGGA